MGCQHPCRGRLWAVASANDEIDRNGAGIALTIFDRHRFTIARPQLIEQRQRIVVADETQWSLPGSGASSAPEDGGMAKAFGDATCVEGIDRRGRQVQMWLRDGASCPRPEFVLMEMAMRRIDNRRKRGRTVEGAGQRI